MNLSTRHLRRPGPLRLAGLLAVLVALGACRVDDPAPVDLLSRSEATSAAAPTRVADDIAYGPLPNQRLDVLRPTTRPTNRRAIVWLHGGGWVVGDENSIPPLLTALVEEDGYTVFSVAYRLAPDAPFPAAVTDVDRAMRWVALHAGEYGVDRERLVTVGFSSGAHLALLQGLSGSTFAAADLPPTLAAVDPTPSAIVALAAPADLPGFSLYTVGGREMVLEFLGCRTFDACDPRLVERASPLRYADPLDPSIYLAQGDLDAIIPVAPTDEIAEQLELAIGIERVWYDRIDSGPAAGRGHEVDYGINRRALGVFIAAVGPR